MSEVNADIIKYIKYYSTLHVAPEYALLIEGSWGSGKTFIVKRCITELKEKESELDFFYISLNGLSSIDDIDGKFFQLLHPILSSKGMLFAGQLSKAILRGTLKIDLDGDGNSEGTVTASVPSIKRSQIALQSSKCVIVFDDFERCPIPIQELLGYINQFVEHKSCKVLVIADADRIIDNESKYWSTAKEKVIGKSLRVQADIQSVFDTYVKDVLISRKLKKEFNSNRDFLVLIFNASECNNLRLLRRAFLEFEKLWGVLDKEVKAKQDLIRHLQQVFFILCLEIYSGKLQIDAIRELFGPAYISRLAFNTKELTSSQKELIAIGSKYPLDFSNPLLDISDWEALFKFGNRNSNQINNSLKLSRYFEDENTPDWARLIEYKELEDSDFDRIKLSIFRNLSVGGIKRLGEIKHVIGGLFELSKEGLIAQEYSQVKSICIEAVDKVFESQTSHDFVDEYQELSKKRSYGGYMFLSHSCQEYKDCIAHMDKKILSMENKKLEEESLQVLADMRHDVNELFHKLCHFNNYNSPYYSIPILKHIDLDDLMSGLAAMTNKDKSTLSSVFKLRYGSETKSSPLIDELEWLQKFNNRIEQEVDRLGNTPTKSSYKLLSDELKSSIGYLMSLK